MRFYEDVKSISDADSAAFHLDTGQGSSIGNPRILEFQSLHGLIPVRISCDNIAFNKKEIGTTTITLESWFLRNMVSAFVMLLNQGNAFAVETNFIPTLYTASCLR